MWNPPKENHGWESSDVVRFGLGPLLIYLFTLLLQHFICKDALFLCTKTFCLVWFFKNSTFLLYMLFLIIKFLQRSMCRPQIKNERNERWQKTHHYGNIGILDAKLPIQRIQKIYNFIALIHPIQWTIAKPVGADRPAKRQKKTSCVSTGWPVPVLCIRQVAHGIYFLSRQHDVIASFSFGACIVRTCFQQSPDILRKSVLYDGFSTFYMDMFSVEVLPTDQARIYI